MDLVMGESTKVEPLHKHLAKMIAEYRASLIAGGIGELLADNLTRHFSKAVCAHWANAYANPPFMRESDPGSWQAAMRSMRE